MISPREPDYAAGGDVQNCGEEQPSLPGRDKSDVAAPAGVDLRGVGGELPADQVRAGSGRRVGDGGLLPPPALQPGPAHQPGDPLARMRTAAAAQLGMNPRSAVAAFRILMDGPDL